MKANRLEREMDLIENDFSLTPEKKRRELRELLRDYRDAAREAAERAYDDEMDQW